MDLNRLIEKSNRKLVNVHPYVKNKAIELIKKAYAEGIYVQITQGFRSIEEQNELYAIGRTKPGKKVTNAKGGQSIHNYGLAFDIVILNNDGSLNWNTSDKRWKRVGQIGQSIGLEWGGTWKTFKDYPHFQYTFGLTLKDLQRGKRPPNSPSLSTQTKKKKKKKKKLQEVMKMKMSDFVNDYNMKQLATVYREAREQGLLSDDRWEKKAENHEITVGEVAFLATILDHRRFRDFCKK